MKKLSCVLLLLYLTIFIFSCENKKYTNDGFDLTLYDVKNYNKKVIEFIQTRTSIDFNSDFDVYIANTSDCNSCAKSNIENLIPKIVDSHSFYQKYVFINDSTLINKNQNTDKIEFIYRNINEYKKFGIYHSKIYLYQFRNGNLIKSSEI